MTLIKRFQRGAIASNPSTPSVPPGTVIWQAGNTAPSGYLKANGATVSRAAYADLFAAIGIIYGAGDGSTTFAIPDLRGEFVRGWDDGRGINSGRMLGSYQEDETKSHNHKMGWDGTAGLFKVNPGSVWGLSGIQSVLYQGMDVSFEGGSETRPRNIALLVCIKF